MTYKNYYNYIMLFLLFYAFLTVLISSYILWFVLPRALGLHGDDHCLVKLTGEGMGGPTGEMPLLSNIDGVEWFVFELPRFVWVDIHSWLSIALFLLIFVHLLLHWRWLIETTKRIASYISKNKKLIVEFYTAFITLFILFAFETLSGIIIWLIIPRGTGDYEEMIAGIGRTFWGLQRNEWSDLHAWAAIAIVAIIVIHIIVHWRWIIYMTLGKKRSKETTTGMVQWGYNYTDINRSSETSYLPRIATLIGLFAAVTFLLFTIIYQLDWASRYGFMLYLIPIPFIGLLAAHKWPFIGGIFLVIIGVFTIFLDLNFNIGQAIYVVGAEGIGFTISMIAIPLIVSGILFILVARWERTKCVKP
ncbi:MAG: DUF4405 domain-containing protein [Dehalococcoidales bacterium]|jgi:hypothetical protein